MRILWITNIIFPVPSRALGLSEPVVGGWMIALARQLFFLKDIRLAVATVYQDVKIRELDIEGVLYFLLPSKSMTTYQRSLEPLWRKICDDFNPDIVHIHGTEYSHGLACMYSCPNLNYVLSIQGMVSIYSRYYYGGISTLEILKSITLRDIVRRDTLFQAKRKFQKRGILEKEYFLRSQHIIGRTNWDYAHSNALNPLIKYHFCNELLRDRFYTAIKWDINKKSDYTIFLSQSVYPIKGLHNVLKAMSTLKNDFPDIKLRVAGSDITKNNCILERIRLSGYGNYIRRLLKRYELNKNVIFTGILDDAEMSTEYLKAHIFICPSAIENSPNSLGEAQLLGVPCIASYSGGIPEMVSHGESGLLYRFEEVELLTYYIKSIFLNDTLAMKLSNGGKKAASERHDLVKNVETMKSIYKEILEEKHKQICL